MQIKKLKEYAEKHRDLILSYKNANPLVSNSKLAGIIIKDHPEIRLTVSSFRQAIPYAVERSSDDVSLDEDEFQINIPGSFYEERERFKIPTAIDRLLVISDLQIPFHHIGSIKLALKYGYDEGARGIFINGDLIDFYAISKYPKIPALRNVKAEIDLTKMFLKNLRDKFPDLEIYWKLGNHENRLERFLSYQAPEFYELDELSFDTLFGLNPLRIRLIDDLTISEFGRLNIIHGHEIRGGGINVARNFRIKASDNLLCGHFHRTQEDLHRTIKGKVQGSWVTGCLCGLSPEWLPINNWNHGFGFLTREQDGNFTVDNKKIIGGYIY